MCAVLGCSNSVRHNPDLSFFNADWTLSEVREGQLLDLADDLERRRPAFVDLE